MKKYDLLRYVQYGGCAAKLNAEELDKALASLPKTTHPNVLVDIETHDDAGVFKIDDNRALIQTIDFFPPVCSDAYDYGQIAAANALSDVYAMGGTPLNVLNMAAFPKDMPVEVIEQILKGGMDKAIEAGAVIMGGHTITSDTPVYGMSVTGEIHPEKIITNNAAKPGDVLILTKAIGSGIVMAGHRIGEASNDTLKKVLESMKQLNKEAARVMQTFEVRCATDITGFGLLGHALKMAKASNVTMSINAKDVPLFEKALFLSEMGCIPGACFTNQEYVQSFCSWHKEVDYALKMLLMDAQTSGGLLMCVKEKNGARVVNELRQKGYIHASIIGHVEDRNEDIYLHI